MSSNRDHANYYEILEIPHDAASTEIHKAYQRARQTYSADNPALYSMFSPDEAKELLRLIDEAYNVLGNQATRKTYDDSLGSKSSAAPGTSTQPIAQMSQQPSASQQSSVQSSAQMAAPIPPAVSARSENFSANVGSSSASSSNDEFVVKRKTLAQAAMPAGQGRTSLSTFKLDDTFESEIQAATEFDGGFIQRVRLYKNISIDKMADATRISRPYLMAVETNDYKSLPAAVFVRGFIVQVSKQLGLDDTKVAASYMKLFKAGGGK